MRTWAQELAYAEGQRLHPDLYVRQGGHCQWFGRTVVGANAWAPSALSAALAIPAAHRFSLANAKAGMLGFAAYRDAHGNYKQYGHTFLLVESHYVYSTDLPVFGRVGKVPLTLITTTAGWNMPLLWFTNWTPSGMIALKPEVVLPAVDLSAIQLAAKTDPKAAQGHQTYAYGVRLVEGALVKEGLLNAALARDGSFGSVTITAYKGWQVRAKSPYRDGIPRMPDLAMLGRKYGWRVVL